MSRPKLPERSNSTLTSGPPTDAVKPDDAAIDDVYREVSSTGSLQAAAKRLEQYARWADDPEEAGYLEQENEEVVDDEEYEEERIGDERMNEDGDGRGEVVHLQEVVDGLWVGDLVAAMDTEGLEQRGITNILSLLRPRLVFPPSLSVYPLEIDDAADTDLLTHLPSCVAWIEAILDLRRRSLDPSAANDPPRPRALEIAPIAQEPQPGGVLVHCQAGMSRSASVVAAYLMKTMEMDPMEAVDMLRERRPVVEPSSTFWHQLGLYYNADGRVSLKDRSTRQFYMERTTSQFMNGDGGAPSIDKMAKYPGTPSPSNPPTPMGGHGRRKIRCKMCRRHLAVREHMMDHILDQVPPPASRPRTPSNNFTLGSPRTSFSNGSGPGPRERRPSVVSDVINPLTGLPGATRSRHASMSSLILSPDGTQTIYDRDSQKERETSKESSGSGSANGNWPISPGVPLPRTLTPGLVLTSSSPEVTTQGKLPGEKELLPSAISASPNPISRAPSSTPSPSKSAEPNLPTRTFQSAEQLASRLPPHLLALRTSGGGMTGLSSPIASSPGSSPERESTIHNPLHSFPPASSAPVSGSGEKTGAQNAARKMSLLAMTPAAGSGSGSGSSASPGAHESERRGSANSEFGLGGGSAPILVNPKCSGYFVEPLTWMEPMLKSGQIAGKLVCPNEKCGVKIGNFDWAGVQCGCKEWVTPGFCIHRSKVDEVW
ncbi:hypothetical protein IAR55_002810 [Kwoniella newhampshirensis]|uniref:protein-tyrosine-phosphatase n=1 Tax=Kwoniella newhampshirensis TaxID=1651941 RepID=A0AAW0YP23_9TREE